MNKSKLDAEISELELEIGRIGRMFYSPELADKQDYLKHKLKNLYSKRGT